MFQTAVPVAKVLQGIHNSGYVLPAIQREFVWKTEQIRSLFDSLTRWYGTHAPSAMTCDQCVINWTPNTG